MKRPIIIGNRGPGGLWWRVPIATLLWLLFAAPIIAGLVALGVVREHAEDLPMTPDLDAWLATAPRSTTILAADQSLLAELPFYLDGQSGHRMPVAFEDIPPVLLHAILAAEDLRFFEHEGVDARAVLRSAWMNYRAGRIVQGASTITQQLARNLVADIGTERSLRRKIREALLARRIEAHHSKKKIFEAYANYVFLGANAYGVAAASRAYFSKAPSALSLPEAALIAGLIQIPGRGNPYVDMRAATSRRNVVLERMLRAGLIDTASYRHALNARIALRPPPERYGRMAPWATEAARQYAESSMPAAFARGGLRIETTVLPAVAHETEELAGARARGVRNGGESAQVGAVLFDHHSGYIEVLVGGRDWRKTKFNRASQGCRQPGSAFKPLVYGAALEAQVITPATPLRDGPISEYDVARQVHWKPTNSGRAFRGVAIAQDALASSLNTPAVDVYDRIGGPRVIDFATRMGIRTPLRDLRPLALGASCVIPIELATAYAVIARGGLAVQPILVRSIVDRGRRTEDRAAYFDPGLRAERRLDRMVQTLGARSERITDEGTAYQLRSMLRAVVKRGTATAARDLPMSVAGKTGTTNNNTDAWFVGFSSRATAAVWLGHDDPQSNLGRGQDGSHAALPLWKELMRLAEASRPGTPLPGPPPSGLTPARIDRDTGLLAAPGAGGALELYFKRDNVPTEVAGRSAQVGRDFERSSGAF